MMKLIRTTEEGHPNGQTDGLISALNQQAMLGKLQRPEIEKVLEQQVIGRIGCYANGTVYIVPISYAYDGEYIYGRTHEGLKIDIMRKNPEVCFEVDIIERMSKWKSVIAWGRFEELHEGELRTEALKKLMARHLPLVTSETVQLSSLWPFNASETEVIEGVVYRIKLGEKTGRFETDETTTDFPW
jgi:hypothetical protein